MIDSSSVSVRRDIVQFLLGCYNSAGLLRVSDDGQNSTVFIDGRTCFDQKVRISYDWICLQRDRQPQYTSVIVPLGFPCFMLIVDALQTVKWACIHTSQFRKIDFETNFEAYLDQTEHREIFNSKEEYSVFMTTLAIMETVVETVVEDQVGETGEDAEWSEIANASFCW
jgi:hypothetical protein